MSPLHTHPHLISPHSPDPGSSVTQLSHVAYFIVTFFVNSLLFYFSIIFLEIRLSLGLWR